MWLVENRTSFRYQKVTNTERVIIIKRYCQNADFTNLTFIEMCCYEYLDEKWERNDVSNMFATYLKIPLKRVKEMQREELIPAIPKIALDIKARIESGRLRLRPIKYFQKVDGMNGKLRTLGIEEPIHQIMNYVCVNADADYLHQSIFTTDRKARLEDIEVFGRRTDRHDGICFPEVENHHPSQNLY